MIDQEKFELFFEKINLIMDETIRNTQESMGIPGELSEHDKRGNMLMKNLVRYAMEALVEEVNAGRLSV